MPGNLQKMQKEFNKDLNSLKDSTDVFVTEWRTTVKGYDKVNARTANFIDKTNELHGKIYGEVKSAIKEIENTKDWIKRLEVTLAMGDRNPKSTKK